MAAVIQVTCFCMIFYMLGYDCGRGRNRRKAKAGRKSGMHFWTLKRNGDGWIAV